MIYSGRLRNRRKKHERKIHGLSSLSHGEPQIWALGGVSSGWVAWNGEQRTAAEEQCVKACKTVRDSSIPNTLFLMLKAKNR
jgi:hypothetical protein